MPRTTLITGATGFTGINLVRRFAEAGDRVIAVDRVAPDAAVHLFLQGHEDRVQFVEADLCATGWEGSLPSGPIELVVHAAAVTNQREDEEVPRAGDAIAVNVGATLDLVRWASAVRPARFVYISTGAPYGRALDGAGLIDETTPANPVNVYAVTKFAGELVALRLAGLSGLPAVAIRLPSQYGPMERATPDRTRLSLLQRWCNAAVRGERIKVNSQQLPRDYTYVPDGAQAVYALATAPTLHHELYNVSTEMPLTYREILAALEDVIPGIQIEPVEDAAPDRSDRRPLSAQRLRSDTGWEPKYDIRSGIATYVAWLRLAIAAGVRTL